ncbi:histidine triad nucleotide-binding protein 3 [Drosophila innubila]|uniref:histidine triad nucleotide-binding protein 3 n=1 Tax=Drosophila innubila TaxID=198719 RepID=UPI00148C773B|nr:histidine triad nucleotide-binding protein 3 [Drosophila innubila]
MNNKWNAVSEILWRKKKCILLFLLVFLLFILFIKYSIETGKSINTVSPSNCLFCKIANGSRTPHKLEFENDEYVIFMDKRPVSTHHYLAIPKTHYDSLNVLNKSHVGLVSRMQHGMIRFLESKGVDTSDAIIGFHIPPFISQKHLHLHGISPVSEMSLSNRISFLMPSFWAKAANDAIDELRRSEL